MRSSFALSALLACALAAACSSKTNAGPDGGAGDGGARDGGRRLDAGDDDGGAGADPLTACITACEAQQPGAKAKIDAIFECANTKCVACDPDAAPEEPDAGAADAGDEAGLDAGDGGGDAGPAVCARVGRAPGQFSMLQDPACDACVGAQCCDLVNACLSDADCAALNACEDRCVLDNE